MQALELDNASKWQRFSTSLEAERDLPPLRGVSPFQKVLLVQPFRPDRLQSALLLFCMDMMRIDSISPPPLSLAALYAESDPTTPLLLLSSPGADASKGILRSSVDVTPSVIVVSMFSSIMPHSLKSLSRTSTAQELSSMLRRSAAGSTVEVKFESDEVNTWRSV